MNCPNCAHANPTGSKFCNNCGYKLLAGTPPAPIPSPSAVQASNLQRFVPAELLARLESARLSGTMAGERRVVTMLFCDIKGSTAAAGQLDPEEWAEIMNGAFEVMIRPVYKYEGTVGRLMGDAVLAFFGAPIAHEDDPVRAVLAALEIVEAMQAYRAQLQRELGLDVNVRVGINTGLVMVGAVGSDLRMEYTAMGDAINLAARMEQTAEPGTIQITGHTYRLVSSRFEFENLGAIEVKGKSQPVQAYRVLRRKSSPVRGRGIEGLAAPLIGRREEEDRLHQVVANLEHGTGGIVCLVGEAGLGKSRLIQELKVFAADHPSALQWYETFSLSYESGEPYALFRRLVRRTIGAGPDDPPEVLLEQIGRAVQDMAPDDEDTVRRVLQALFGLAGASGEPPMQGESFKGHLYTVMQSLWKLWASRSPTVLVCDDLHWSDPASVDLLLHLLPVALDVPLLLVCALRPEHDTPGWRVAQAASEHTAQAALIQLRPLNHQESAELVDNLLHISDLPPGLHSQILGKSEGNPFFVEEVVRTLIDQGVIAHDQDGSRWVATGDGSEIDIPGNLQSLLIARIDRLAEDARSILQVASVIGRSFYFRVLARLVEAAGELDGHLLALQRTGLIQEAAQIPELEYIFRHALTQEAAYSTILLKQRRILHHQVGETLEALFSDQVEEIGARLAHHFFQARDHDRALKFYTLAGDVAFRLHAHHEAIDHYRRALECAAKVGAGSRQWVHIYSRLGRSYEHAGQFDDAQANYRLMVDLAAQRGEPALELAALAAQCILHATQTPLYDPPLARQLGERALDLARQLDDPVIEAKVLWGLLLVEAWGGGDLHKGLDYGQQSLAIARELGLNEQMGYTHTNLVNIYWGLDRLDAARDANLEARAIWLETGNTPMLADSYSMSAWSHWLAGENESFYSAAREASRLGQSIGNPWNHIAGLTLMAEARLAGGQIGPAIEYAREAANLHRSAGSEASALVVSRLLVEAYQVMGALDEARRQADEIWAHQAELFPHMFRLLSLATVVRAKVACNELDQAGEALHIAAQLLGQDLEGARTDLLAALHTAGAHLHLALGEPKLALDRLEYLTARLRRAGIRAFLPEALWLQAQALSDLAKVESARQVLLEALDVAEATHARLVLWQILAALARIEAQRGSQPGAAAFRTRARAEIAYLAEHAGSESLRTSFLSLPEVAQLLSN